MEDQLHSMQLEKADLEILLQTTTEHADLLLRELQREKTDLEILLDTTTEHSTLVEFELQTQTREAQRQTEEQFRLIAAATPAAILIVRTTDGEIAYANETAGILLGDDPDCLLGQPIANFCCDPQDYLVITRAVVEQLQFQGESQFKRRDGSAFWAWLSLRPFVFKGKPTILIAGYDITDRKQAQEALQRAEEKYRGIFDNALEGIFQTTPEGRYISVNPAMARMFGYESPEEMIANVTDVRQEYLKQSDRDEFVRLMELDGQVTDFERCMYRRDRSVLWISESARAVRDQQGQLLYYEGIVEDITQRKLAEEALRAAEEKYRSIFENAVEGIFQSTPTGRYVSVNPAMAHLFGYSSPQAMLDSIMDIPTQVYVSPDQRREFEQSLALHGEIKGFEYEVYRCDGSTIWVSEWARAVRDPQGELLYYEGSCIEITQRKKQEEVLKQQLRELQIEIDQVKRERQVAEITESDYFQTLLKQADELRFSED